MKKILSHTILTVLVLFFFSCNTTGYKLSGHIADSSVIDHNVFLCDAFSENYIDTAIIASDGTFEFNGYVDEPILVRLIVEYNSEIGTVLVLENGKISLDVSKNEETGTYLPIIGGTPLNDEISKMDKYGRALQDSVISQINAVMSDITLSPNEIEEKRIQYIKNYLSSFSELCNDTYSRNSQNVVGLFTLLNWITSNPEINLDSLVSVGGEIVKNNPFILQQLEIKKKLDATSVGKKFLDLIGKNINNKESRLSDYVGNGKVAVIDFWASWCAPCRAEVKNLKQIKSVFGDQITIVGLNVHDTFDECKKAIAEESMNWPQIIDENNTFTDIYGIDGIPQIILIDKDGTILARDLRGEDLYNAVNEVINR